MRLVGFAGGAREPSEEFKQMIREVLGHLATSSDDDALRYMVENIKVYAAYEPTMTQREAGGCVRADCRYLGLWADRWEGYPKERHGMIWLFEKGIREQAPLERVGVIEQVERTLLHEFGHALQRDHVLEDLEKRRTRMGAAAMAYRRPSGCSTCGY